MSENLRAVIYARYSSDNQREESIEGQIRECLEFANRIGVTVIAHYIDRALTATSDNRPDFQRMIRDSNKHCFDMVIVWKLDRFSRDRYDSAHYKHLLKKNGVKVVSAKENIGEGPEGIILESMLEGMAEYYSAELSVKVKRGLKENALKGKVNGGQIPYGYYINEEQKLSVDETLAPIVVEIFTMYDEGKMIKEIVKHLNDRGIRTRHDKPMSYNIIQYMLSNRRYIGEYRFNDIVIPDAIPQIVDMALFDRVQARLEKNKHAPARHKAEDDYLLTTKLFCGKCGAYMVGEAGTARNKTVHRYYKCVNAKKHTCDKKTVRKEWIEDLAVQKALEILNDEVLVSYLVDTIFDLQTDENPRLPRLREQLADVEKRIGNIIQAIEQGMIFESTKERLTQLEKEKRELDMVILEEQIQRPFLTKEQIRFGIEKFKKLDLSTKDGKQRLIDGFINAIYLYDDKITFTLNYKDGTKTVFLSELVSAPSGSDLKCFTAPKSRGRGFPLPLDFSSTKPTQISLSHQAPPKNRWCFLFSAIRFGKIRHAHRCIMCLINPNVTESDMVQDVYIDLLFLINFSMDYLCLYICSKILHRRMRLWKMLTAAALGGVYSVVSIFLPISSVQSLFIDCAVCLFMCGIVYLEKGRGIGSMLLSTFLFIGISMMTGGCMTAIFNLLNKLDLPLDLVEDDGISTYLFAALALIAGIISLKSGQIISRRAPTRECRLYVKFCGKDFEFLGFSDSGNLVRDPLTGKPVIFVERELIEKEQSLDFLDKFALGEFDPHASPCKSLRLISLMTASGTSLAVAAQPESVRAEFEDKKGKTVSLELNALISPTKIGQSAQGYTAIVPSEIIKQ